MDFLNPKKRRAHRNRLLFGYVLMTLGVAIATYFVVLLTSGFGFDPKSGTVVQNGLVFVSAKPETAKVTINGKDRGETDGRYVLEEGNYTVQVARDGYRTWQRSFVLEPSSIERLVYPFLFPEKLKTTDVQLYASAPNIVSLSPDRHWIVTHANNSLNSFQVIDTTTKENTPVDRQLPTSVLTQTGTNHNLRAIEWSSDNKHLLLEHTYDDKREYVIFDREEPKNAVNLSKLFPAKAYTKLALRDKGVNELYALGPDGVLEILNVKDKKVTAVLDKVVEFFPYGDDVLLYATPADGTAGKTSLRMRQDNKSYTIRTVNAADGYLLATASFDGKQYVVVGTSADSQAFVYVDPIKQISKATNKQPAPTTVLRVPSDGRFVSFSANARFIALQGKGAFAVYDAEEKRLFRYGTGLNVAAEQKLAWMDGHRLSGVIDGTATIFDFDGTNVQKLQSASGGTQILFDRDYKAMFTLGTSQVVKDRPALQRTNLLVEK